MSDDNNQETQETTTNETPPGTPWSDTNMVTFSDDEIPARAEDE